MAEACYRHPAGMGLSEIAEEFRDLDLRRRKGGLPLGEAERYHSLFRRLSDALESGERHRRVDARQFLRVPFYMELVLRTADGERRAVCHDFGGGGCAISSDEQLETGADVWLDGAMLEGTLYPLHGRAVVVGARPPVGGKANGYGLRFAIDSDEERDQIDRVLYRVLDVFLNGVIPLRRRVAVSR